MYLELSKLLDQIYHTLDEHEEKKEIIAQRQREIVCNIISKREIELHQKKEIAIATAIAILSPIQYCLEDAINKFDKALTCEFYTEVLLLAAIMNSDTYKTITNSTDQVNLNQISSTYIPS